MDVRELIIYSLLLQTTQTAHNRTLKLVFFLFFEIEIKTWCSRNQQSVTKFAHTEKVVKVETITFYIEFVFYI